jgi:hypothetical protein
MSGYVSVHMLAHVAVDGADPWVVFGVGTFDVTGAGGVVVELLPELLIGVVA